MDGSRGDGFTVKTVASCYILLCFSKDFMSDEIADDEDNGPKERSGGDFLMY